MRRTDEEEFSVSNLAHAERTFEHLARVRGATLRPSGDVRVLRERLEQFKDDSAMFLDVRYRQIVRWADTAIAELEKGEDAPRVREDLQ